MSKAVGCSFLTLWRLSLSPITVHVGFVMNKVFFHALRVFLVIFIVKMARAYLSITDTV